MQEKFFVPSLSHEKKWNEATGADTWIDFRESLLPLGFCPLP
jgi:hypothetical protein